MHLLQRAALYLIRCKAKSIILYGLYFIISLTLFLGISVLSGAKQISKDLRSDIGASFDIRPCEQLKFEDGEISGGGTPAVDEVSLQEVLSCIGNELKAYNTEQYGYVKGADLAFLKGAGHSPESNMGKVISLRDSALSRDFINEEKILAQGSHIRADDKNKILISKGLAESSGLKIGDRIELTHAQLGNRDGIYIDLITEKTESVTAEVAGIYQLKTASENGLTPTADRKENLIYASSNLLVDLKEQKRDIYEGELSFFIKDPLHLDEIIRKVKEISSIDWENHILVDNDFKYAQIDGQLQNIQNIVLAITGIICVLGISILAIMLTMRTRGRIRETGILLSLGKTKSEIICQFAAEVIFLLCIGFLSALFLSGPASDVLNRFLLHSLADVSGKIPIMHRANFPQAGAAMALLLFAGETCTVVVTVLLSGAAVLLLKPGKILSKMS